MGVIKLLAAPIRSIVRFPLFQLAVVVAVILLLQAADDNSAFGQIFNGLDKLVVAPWPRRFKRTIVSRRQRLASSTLTN